MPTILEVYNGALGWLKETRLVSTSEARAARRELDAHWDKTLAFMLEQGMWNFAGRKATLTAASTDVVGFGFTYTFTRPTDYVRIIAISLSEHLTPTLNDFEEYSDAAGNYFRAYSSPLYLNYVSNSTNYGANPSKWPPTFTMAMEQHLAIRAQSISNLPAEDLGKLVKMARGTLADAQSADAVNQPATALPLGRLVRSRMGSGRGINQMRKIGYPGG